ncbi:MAG: hypothetical protein IKZ65_05740, partial [Lachnospiraceae bacterium]|nr:hypothetical protein [Lachnospiraceae bacterium]
IDKKEMLSCASDPDRIIKVFKAAGFTAYDDTMIDNMCSIFRVSPDSTDFQFDIYPDGSIGEVFSLSALYELRRREETLAAFYDGDDSRYIALLTEWGLADDRWKQVVDTVYSGTLPLPAGDISFIAFPQAFKVRWRGGELVPSKAYVMVKATEKRIIQ